MKIVGVYRYEGRYKIRCACEHEFLLGMFAKVGRRLERKLIKVVNCRLCEAACDFSELEHLSSFADVDWDVIQNLSASESAQPINKRLNQDAQFRNNYMMWPGRFGKWPNHTEN